MRDQDRIFRTFEEFEREELRRAEALGASVDEMIDSIFGEESRKATQVRSGWDDDEE
jgi:hypothetical protein